MSVSVCVCVWDGFNARGRTKSTMRTMGEHTGRERHRDEGGRGEGGEERETESEKETWRSNGHPRFPF